MIDLDLAASPAAVVPDVKRIAVLKASALGDFILTLPALDAVRRAYPSAAISLLGRPLHRDLVGGRRDVVDEVIVVPHGAIGDEDVGYRPEARAQLLAGMRRDIDLALQLHGGGRNSNPLVAALGARVTAGARTPDAAPLDRTIHYDVYQSDALRSLETVRLVGATSAPLEPTLPATEEDVSLSRAALPDSDRPIALVHPGATDVRRRWPPRSFAAVADALVEAGALVCLTGVEAERAVVAQVAAAARHDLIDLSGKLSLRALMGLQSRALVVVSNDTGVRHLAAAVGTATVAIYWVGNVITAGPPTRDRHRVVISWRTKCPECGRDCISDDCSHRPSFVAEVPVGDVIDHALDLLATEAQRAVGFPVRPPETRLRISA